MDAEQREAKQTAWDFRQQEVSKQDEANKKETKQDKYIIAWLFLALICFATANYLNSNDLSDLKEDYLRLEQSLGEFNNYSLRSVVFEIGEVLEDKAENCNGLISSVDDVVFCQKVGI